MRLRGIVVAFAAMLLLAAMFLAVHRGTRGRALAQEVGALNDRIAAAEVRREEMRGAIQHLRSRGRIMRAARELGLRMPDEPELVILDLTGGVIPGQGP